MFSLVGQNQNIVRDSSVGCTGGGYCGCRCTRTPRNCLCPHSSCVPLHSYFPSAVDIWMFFLYYFDMFLLDKLLQPFWAERRMKFMWLFPLNWLSHFQHVMNWNVIWAYLEKQYWKHEGGLYHVYHYLDTALCENDNQCWFNIYWMLITLIFFFFWQWFVKSKLTFVSYE